MNPNQCPHCGAFTLTALTETEVAEVQRITTEALAGLAEKLAAFTRRTAKTMVQTPMVIAPHVARAAASATQPDGGGSLRAAVLDELTCWLAGYRPVLDDDAPFFPHTNQGDPQ